MRDCDPALAGIIASGLHPYWRTEIFDVTLQNGTTFYWTSFDRDVPFSSNTYTSQGPFLKRGKWSVTNTMQIPALELGLLALTGSFNGGLDIRSQIAQGLFDGAHVLMRYLYVDGETFTGEGPVKDIDVLGTILIFGGVVSTADLAGSGALIKIKGANNKLDQNVPRRVYQVQCNNTFCDTGCTLNRATFTASYIVGASPAPTRSFIPWATAPGSPGLYQLGTLTMTSGVAAGESMNIDFADSSGITLSFPLSLPVNTTPSPGDTFDAFEGCNKTRTLCASRGNTQNGLWFPYVPPADTAF